MGKFLENSQEISASYSPALPKVAANDLGSENDSLLKEFEVESGEVLTPESEAAKKQEDTSPKKSRDKFLDGEMDSFDYVQSLQGEGMKTLMKAGAGAIVDIGQGVVNTAADAGNFIEKSLKEAGIVDINVVPDDFKLDIYPRGNNDVENSLRTVGSYLLPFGAALKAFSKSGKAAKLIKASFTSSAVSAVVLDPDDGRLADTVQSVPILSALVPSYLESEKDDSRAEARFKTGLESLWVDALTFGAGSVIKKSFGAAMGVSKNIKLLNKATKGLDEAEQLASKMKGEAAGEGARVSKVTLKEGSEEAAAKGVDDLAKAKKFDDDLSADIQKGKDKKLKEQAKDVQQANDILIEPKLEDINLDKAMNATTREEWDEALKISGSKEADFITNTVRRGTISFKEVDKIVKRQLKDSSKVEKILRKEIGEALNVEDMGTLKAITIRESANVFSALPKDIVAASKAEQFKFIKAWQRYRYTRTNLQGAKAEAGRALGILNHTFDQALPDEGKFKLLESSIDMHGGTETIKDIMKTVKRVQESKGGDITAGLMKAATQGKLSLANAVLERYVINNMLSSPATHTVAAIGNAVMGVENMIIAAGTEAIGAVRIGANPAKGEAYAHLKGMFQGMTEGFSEAKEFVKGKGIKSGNNFVFDSGGVITSEALGIEAGTGMGNFIDVAGKTLAVPSKGLQANDIFFRNIAKRSRTNQLIIRQANKAGVSRSSVEYKNLIQEMTGDIPDSIAISADKEAASSVFMAPFSDTPIAGVEGLFNIGEAAGSLAAGVEQLPLGKIVSPFMRITANMAEYTSERLPILSRLNPKVRAAIAAGGADKAEAQAKMAFGAGIIGLFSYQAYQGNVTGSSPHTRKMQKALQGDSRFAENTVMIGDTPVKYDRLGAVGLVMGIGADIGEMAGYAQTEEEKEQLTELAAAGATILSHAFTPSFMRESLTDFLNIIKDPSKAKLGGGTAGKLLPFGAMMKQIRKETDPTKRETEEIIKDREGRAKEFASAWETLKNEFRNNIPGLSDELPAMLNVFGDEVAYPPGFGPDIISPFYVNKIKSTDKPIYKELQRLGLDGGLIRPSAKPGDAELAKLTMPSRVVNDASIFELSFPISKGQTFSRDLNAQEYHDLIKETGKGLKKSIQDLMLSSGYQSKNRSDAFRKMMIGKVIGIHQNIGKKVWASKQKGIKNTIEFEAKEFKEELSKPGGKPEITKGNSVKIK